VWITAGLWSREWHSTCLALVYHQLSCCLMGKIVSKLQQKVTSSHGQAGKFPFIELPDVCKVHVFSFLSTEDRVLAAHVCREWRLLLSSPVLWTNVDVPASVRAVRASPQADKHCEVANYHDRVKKYLDFIGNVDPCIRRFVFVGDIAETVYHDSLRLFLTSARLSELKHVSINWAKVDGIDVDAAGSMEERCEDCASSWSVDENHRRRQRYFVHLFEQLCGASPNITSLSLPFDWSPKSVDAIVSLRSMEELSLGKYSELQALDCVTLDRVITSLPQLRRLELEVWTPCVSGGLTYYSVRSKSLEFVDLAKCRGFALGCVDLPRVTVLRLSRCLWSGPLMVQSTTDICSLPCLHRVLSEGVPNLKELNGHKLHADWYKHVDDELELLLKSICPCDLHFGWATVVADCF